nr:hypothetical protein [Tanacetum cinerariifolium]
MEMQFGAVGSSRRRQKSVFASVPAIGGRLSIEIITIEDDEPVQRRSSSRPPKPCESSNGAAYILNCKELKVDDYKPNINIPSGQLNHSLTNSNDNETLIDETCEMSLSMSHAGGNVSLRNIKILKFVKEAHSYRAGNKEILVPRSETKLILSERKSDGTITMHYCEFDDYDQSAEEELIPTFPNTMSLNHTTYMFAVEFCSLIEREGYTIAGDYFQMKHVSMVQLSDGQRKRSIGPAIIAGKPCPQQQSQRRKGNMMAPGNVVGTGRNIGGVNSTVRGQGSGNTRRGAPCAGRMGASHLAIFDPNPMETKPRIAQRRPSVLGRSRGKSSNTVGSQGGNLEVPSGSGLGSRGWGSCGQGSRGRGSNITPDNNVNPRQRNGMGRQPSMALSRPSVLGEFGEQSSNTGAAQIGNMNIDSSLILGSGSGSGSRGRLVRSFGSSRASDRNRMQRNIIASPRSMSYMNQNQMQQQTNLHPASVSKLVGSGASRPFVSAANQDGSSH